MSFGEIDPSANHSVPDVPVRVPSSAPLRNFLPQRYSEAEICSAMETVQLAINNMVDAEFTESYLRKKGWEKLADSLTTSLQLLKLRIMVAVGTVITLEYLEDGDLNVNRDEIIRTGKAFAEELQKN